MKIKIAVEARIDARDRRRCLTTCERFHGYPFSDGHWCDVYDMDLDEDSHGRPLRCRECLRSEVKP